jgi:1-deoxy-D-xylulose-5-phosphate reductoisomerase
VALNAADEVAVQAFLEGHIELGDIHTILRHTALAFDGHVRDIEDVLRVDGEARVLAKEGLC